MAIKSTCKLCGNTVEGEIKFCPICGGEATVTEDMSQIIPQYTENPYVPVAPQQSEDKKGCAIAGMIVGIVSLVFSCYGIFSLIAGIVGLILSTVGMKSSKRGMAVAGVVCSAIALVFSLISTVACGGVMCSSISSLY